MVRVMVWCIHAKIISPYGVTVPQYVSVSGNLVAHHLVTSLQHIWSIR